MLFIFIAPLLGFIFSTVTGIIVFNIANYFKPSKVDGFFRRAELFSAAAYSLSYGGNDAQKTMGIISMLLIGGIANADIAPLQEFFYSHQDLIALRNGQFVVPLSVVLICHSAIALGTLSGGWRIVKTMGQKITRLRPVDGFCAEAAAGSSIFIASFLGIPVSTTHTMTGSIVGIGALRRLSGVHWGVAKRIVWAWFITIPAAALISAIAYELKVLLF